VLKHLDPAKADDLLKQRQQVQAMLDRYPQGLSAIAPTEAHPIGETQPSGAHEPMATMSFSFGNGPTGGGGGGDAPNAYARSLAAKIMADASNHPEEALDQANALPAGRLRTEALMGIAEHTWEKHPSTAHSALRKVLDSDNPDAAFKVEEVRSVANLYRRMGDNDSAKKAVEKGMSLAQEVYRQDTNADDPNKALKAYWPSTQAWDGMLRIATQISPTWASTLLKEIPDEEIRALASMQMAAELLNVPSGGMVVMTATKSGHNMMMSDME
jgi:hypothetical protein